MTRKDEIESDMAARRSAEYNYPDTLRLTIASSDSMFDQTAAKLEAFENNDTKGPTDEAVRAFENISDLRELLTDQRVAVLRAIHKRSPESISALADRLNRAYSVVHSDVEVLASYDIVHYRKGARGSKQPYIPYQTIRVDIPLVGTTPDTASSLTARSGSDDIDDDSTTELDWLDNAVDPRPVEGDS